MGVVKVMWHMFKFWCPIISLKWVKLGTSNLVFRLAMSTQDRWTSHGLLATGSLQSRDLFIFWQISEKYFHNSTGQRRRYNGGQTEITCGLSNGTITNDPQWPRFENFLNLLPHKYTVRYNTFMCKSESTCGLQLQLLYQNWGTSQGLQAAMYT